LDPSYKLYYTEPAHVNSVGSYPLETITKTGKPLTIDLTVAMPRSIFQEKDYLNHRYFYKRAYYLACIAAGVKANKTQSFKISYEYLHGNHLLPILILDPLTDNPPCHIAILLTSSLGLFPPEKLLPTKACVRPKTSNVESKASDLEPSPFYNASIMSDILATEYLKLQHDVAKECSAYRDACILGRVWLRQRDLSGRIQKGGFGNFEWAVMMALLLQGGGPKGLPVFSNGYSSYQLFKALLQYLSGKDLITSPQTIGDSTQSLGKQNDTPVLFDSIRGMNILFKMNQWSYNLLQFEARVTIAALNDSTFDHFDASFIFKVDSYICKYDAVIQFPVYLFFSGDISARPAAEKMQARFHDMYRVVSRAVNKRAELIALHVPELEAWALDKAFEYNSKRLISIGLVLDPTHASRTVDHGPSAESKKEAADFRKFWGEVAELRRFKDGSILESIVWNPHGGSGSIVQQIVTYSLKRHFGAALAEGASYVGDQATRILPSGYSSSSVGTSTFLPVMTSFQGLERDIKNLEGLPLQMRQIQAADPQLSYSSMDLSFAADGSRISMPADVVIQFEGSARWPDDTDAIERTKFAFLLKLGELLEENVEGIRFRVGLENKDFHMLNQSFLDIIYSAGVAFRLRIHHEREPTLLERRLKDKSLTTQEKLDTAFALASYKRSFLRMPFHTQALQLLSTRFPAFSATVRLVKKWFSSHLLSLHFSDSLIELFVVRTFTNPYPWLSPSSATTGFLRTLVFLSRWDWHSVPWIVDFSSDGMKEAEVSAISTRFEAWRNIDPALNRVVLFVASNIDGDGTTWTDHNRPSKLVAARMSALAQAATGLVKEKGLETQLENLFSSSLADYDVLIRLNPKVTKGAKKPKGTKFKNLQSQTGMDDESLGYDPVNLFVKDLEHTFGHAMVFFLDKLKTDVVAALWNPQTNRAWKLKLGYSSAPIGKGKRAAEQADEEQIEINKGAILNEIARLGGELVSKIETGRIDR
jgi:U3 small nucleolar RNA-associated protein 22